MCKQIVPHNLRNACFWLTFATTPIEISPGYLSNYNWFHVQVVQIIKSKCFVIKRTLEIDFAN